MDSTAISELFARLMPAELFRLLQRELKLKMRDGIYTPRVVLLMMIFERLNPRGTLASSVEHLAEGRFDPVLSSCKRVQEKKIGLGTGGYCQARQRLPKLVVSRSMDELVERLRRQLVTAEGGPRVYLMDGTSLQLEHEQELVRGYPPTRNQHGRGHWPMLRMLVLHDVDTGLAEHPCWGPMHGRGAVSEQALAEQAMARIPRGSVLLGDCNFGIFSVAYAAQQRELGTVLRLTARRAGKLAGEPIAAEGEYAICWRPSRWDGARKKSNPGDGSLPPWPAEACVQGRLIARRVGRGKAKQWLFLFTTMSLPADEVVELYGRRWRIETDLRGLKHTVGLQRVAGRSKDIVDKQLLVAMMAYNLVRAIMFHAAQHAAIDPRQLSFTYACNIVLDSYPRVLAARTEKEQQRELQRIIQLVARCRLPRRSKRRSYPRQIWSSGYHFPFRPAEKTK